MKTGLIGATEQSYDNQQQNVLIKRFAFNDFLYRVRASSSFFDVGKLPPEIVANILSFLPIEQALLTARLTPHFWSEAKRYLRKMDAQGRPNFIKSICFYKNKEFYKIMDEMDKEDNSIVEKPGSDTFPASFQTGRANFIDLHRKLSTRDSNFKQSFCNPLPIQNVSGRNNCYEQQTIYPSHSPNFYKNHYMCTLQNAIINRDMDKLNTIIFSDYFDINSQDANGCTLLHYATLTGKIRVVENLLKCINIEVNITDQHGVSPLHIATRNGLKLFTDALLRHPKIKVNLSDELGNTPLHNATENCFHDGVNALLLHPNIRVNVINNSGATPLHNAVKFTFLKGVIALVNDPLIKVNTCNKQGDTPLHIAARYHFMAGIQVLLRHPDVDINKCNVDNRTARDVAWLNEATEIEQLLAERMQTKPEIIDGRLVKFRRILCCTAVLNRTPC